MLTLSLLRHAKSSWDDPGLGDFDRPLAPRGEDAAPRMGAYMAEHGLAPELILCSPAVRTRQTLDLVLPHLSGSPAIEYEEQLYLASASSLLARVRRVEGKTRHIMLVGHDPGMHGLAVDLASDGSRHDLDNLAAKFPTAGLAVITFKVRRWALVKPGSGLLERFVTPKQLLWPRPDPA